MIFLATLFVFSTVSSPDSLFVLDARQTQEPLIIDGTIDETVWQTAPIATDFIQYEPNRGEPSDQKTEALFLYDAEQLYIAFRVWDAEPLTAQLTRRDVHLFDDDAVAILLDTHNDHRSAYFFFTNPLGTQTDGRVVDDGRTIDLTWDAPWRAASQPTDFGWTVEIAIPFSSIKYVAGSNVSWGINFGRSRRRTLETSFWSGPLDNMFRVSQAGVLTGLDVSPPERRHQIIPYGLTRFQENEKTDWDVGLDARYTLTPEMSAYATINPDFATIEADQEQVNLTRFELSLPEKRQFFLEGNELYRQRIRTFYSRRIPDITAGAKVLGKQGPWTLALLGAYSREITDSTNASYVISRMQRDVLGSSNVAFQLANRSHAGMNEGSLSMDATLFFTKYLGMTAQVVKSYGLFDDGTMAFFIRPAFDSPTGHFHVRYTHMGEHVAENVNTVGFIRDDNRRELDSAIEKIFWIRRGFLERTHYDSNYNIYWGQDGVLRSWKIDQSVEIEFRNRFSFEATFTEEFKRFEKDFRNRQTGLEIGYNTREFQSAQVGVEFGKNFDADFVLWSAEAGYKLTTQLSLEYELARLTLQPDPESESTWIHVLSANQFFTKDLYLRVFFQTNSSIDRKNIQAVFVYRYRPPFGTIQMAYQRGTAAFGHRSDQGNTLFLKVTSVL